MSENIARDNQVCDAFLKRTLARPQNLQPCCRKGCSACCSEVLYASNADVDYILTGMTEAHKAEVAQNVLAWLEKTSGILPEKTPDAVKYRELNAPCPLLKNNLCTVYDRRPFGCRTFFAIGNPADCQLPARKHQKFAHVPEQLFQLLGPPPTLNGELIHDHLGNLLLERLHGIRHFSASRRRLLTPDLLPPP